jgi:hypothetical protein
VKKWLSKLTGQVLDDRGSISVRDEKCLLDCKFLMSSETKQPNFGIAGKPLPVIKVSGAQNK